MKSDRAKALLLHWSLLAVSSIVEEVVSASDVDWTHNDNTFWQWKSSREPSVCLDLIPLFHRVT